MSLNVSFLLTFKKKKTFFSLHAAKTLLEKAEREGYPNLLPCEKNGGGLLN